MDAEIAAGHEFRFDDLIDQAKVNFDRPWDSIERRIACISWWFAASFWQPAAATWR